MKSWQELSLYPALLALAFVLKAFFDADVNAHAATRAFLVIVGGALLLTVVAVLTLGRLRGGLAAAGLLVIALVGQPLHAVVLALLGVLVVGAWFLARRMWPAVEPLHRPTGILNVFGLLLVAVTLLSAAQTGALWRVELATAAPIDTLAQTADGGGNALPDVYLVVLDAYPRADTLDRVFEYDNSAFLSSLEGQGFAVATGGSSNYMFTSLTFTSMFQMDYVDDAVDAGGTASLRRLINQAPVWEAFRERGYQVAANLGHWERNALRGADAACAGGTNSFEMFFVHNTLAGAALQAAVPQLAADVRRESVERALACWERLSQPTANPKVVFVHVAIPHLPIVFTTDGEAADPRLLGDEAQDVEVGFAEFRDGYIGQLEYLNERVEAIVTDLAQREDQPVVLVMSDHGSEARFDYADTAGSDLAERFSNLFVALTPGHPDLFPCDVEPVNVVPILLGAYLGADATLNDSHHYVSDTEDPFGFSEVPDPDGGTPCPAGIP